MKSLQDFYTEQGICRTELAARLGISEAVLQTEEKLPVPTDETQQALKTAFSLPSDYFSLPTEVEKPTRTVDGRQIIYAERHKKYFFGTALVWHILVSLVLAVPVALLSYALVICRMISDTGNGGIPWITDSFILHAVSIATSVSLIGFAFSGVFLANYILKSTTLRGEIRKYQYLYWFLPSLIVSLLNAVTEQILFPLLSISTQTFSGMGVFALVSAVATVLEVVVCAACLETAVADNLSVRRRRLRIICGTAAGATFLTFLICCISDAVNGTPLTVLDWVQGIANAAVPIAAALCVGFVPAESQKPETWIFKILPLTAMLIDIPFAVAQMLIE